jgi:hypothetical protein
MISQYWREQIPAKPLSIKVKDQSGEDMNLSLYTDIEVVMMGSNNEYIDLTGAVVDTSNKASGTIIFRWPTNKTLFDWAGDYVLQLQLSGEGRRDFTTTHSIRVKELGRIAKGNVYYR